MKADELTIEVKAKLDVDRKTADACLKLVEIFINNHAELRLMAYTRESGELELQYEPII